MSMWLLTQTKCRVRQLAAVGCWFRVLLTSVTRHRLTTCSSPLQRLTASSYGTCVPTGTCGIIPHFFKPDDTFHQILTQRLPFNVEDHALCELHVCHCSLTIHCDVYLTFSIDACGSYGPIAGACSATKVTWIVLTRAASPSAPVAASSRRAPRTGLWVTTHACTPFTELLRMTYM